MVCDHDGRGHDCHGYLFFPSLWTSAKDTDARLGSADKSIKLWQGQTLLRTIDGAHGDVVRSIAPLPGIGFLSAANDAYLLSLFTTFPELRMGMVAPSRCGVPRASRFRPCMDIPHLFTPSKLWRQTRMSPRGKTGPYASGEVYIYTRRGIHKSLMCTRRWRLCAGHTVPGHLGVDGNGF